MLLHDWQIILHGKRKLSYGINVSSMVQVKDRIAKLLTIVSEDVLEKEHILSLGLLCCIAGESFFILGPPGTAKSLVARRLREVFGTKRSFEYLMSRFSTPDELFGPVSIAKLKNEDVYERCVDGFLPSATIVFLDEIWKAGPAIQNTLLTVINEKIFQNGTQRLHLPLKGVIAASNELPDEDDGVVALWDRFLVRIVSNCITDEQNFYKMLQQKNIKDICVPPSLCITDECYNNWQKQIKDIGIPEEILFVVSAVRIKLRQIAQDGDWKELDFYISDRRWCKIIHLMQTSAFLNDRTEIDYSDLFLLYYTLWNRAECISVILQIVSDALFRCFYKQLDEIENELECYIKKRPVKQLTKTSSFKVYDHFYFKLENYPLGNCFLYMVDYKYLYRDRDVEGILLGDEEKKRFFIHRFNKETPFSSSTIGQNVQLVSLRCSPGCLIVNGQVYAIVKDNIKHVLSDKVDLPEGKIDFKESLLQEEVRLKTGAEQRLNALVHSDNLFITSDDIMQAKKAYVRFCEKIYNLDIKIVNAFQ